MNDLNRMPAYQEWVRLIAERHAKQLWNEPDVDDEDADDGWDRLPEALRVRLWGLSADLFSLTDSEKRSDADEEPLSEAELALRLAQAFHSEDWDTLLTMLRRGPRFIPADQVAFIRAVPGRN